LGLKGSPVGQHGTFLTQDPIGLAGGVNLYAYAGSNPIAYKDPFGLKVEFENAKAEELYRQMRQAAEAATRSRNRLVASSGRKLLATLTALEDDEEVVRIEVNDGRQNGFGIDRGSNNWAIVVSDQHPGRVAPQVRLAHELGHAYSVMVDGRAPTDLLNRPFSNGRSLETENAARGIWKCAPRIDHDTTILQRFNPSCQ